MCDALRDEKKVKSTSTGTWSQTTIRSYIPAAKEILAPKKLEPNTQIPGCDKSREIRDHPNSLSSSV
ncbi:hypothetical protein OXX69_004498 [Metschnikowia pulcherrima]